jgi:hypothetical protein
MDGETTTIGVRLPVALLDQLRTMASVDDRAISSLIRKIVAERLAADKPKRGRKVAA